MMIQSAGPRCEQGTGGEMDRSLEAITSSGGRGGVESVENKICGFMPVDARYVYSSMLSKY